MPRDVLSISVDGLIYVETIRTLFRVELQTPNMDRLAAMGVLLLQRLLLDGTLQSVPNLHPYRTEPIHHRRP